MTLETFILLLNTALIFILVVMGLLLCAASRFRGESTYASLVILATTVPDYIYNICDEFGLGGFALLMAPLAYASNLVVMPLMLFLAHRAFNPYYVFRWKAIGHFLPALLFAVMIDVHINSLSIEEVGSFTVERAPGMPSFFTAINFIAMTVQIVLYTYWIFSYLRKAKHYILNNRSEAEVASKLWVPRFITLVIVLGIIAMVWCILDPFDGFRLFYVINVVAMSFLLYSELKLVFMFRQHQAPTAEAVKEVEKDFETVEEHPHTEAEAQKEDDMEQLRQYAAQVENYLHTSGAYVNPHLSLRDVASATGISPNKLSKSINAVLDKTFFDLVNGLRVEKSKSLLIEKKAKGYTLETIAEQCGFNSQVTLCNAFKKKEGMTTTQWLKLFKKE